MSVLSSREPTDRQHDLLSRFGTTREACRIVFVLAGTADSQGRTMREILTGAARLTGGRYECAEGFHQLRLARFLLSRAGHLTCAPRVTQAGRPTGRGAFAKASFGARLAWRRSALAEQDALREAKAALEERFPSGSRKRTAKGRGLWDLLPGRRFLKRLTSLLD